MKKKPIDIFAQQAKMVTERMRTMPVPKEYHEVINKYIRVIFKWAKALNHQIPYTHDAAYDRKFTKAAYDLLNQHNFHIKQACCIRDSAVSVFSSVTLVGMHYPTKDAVKKYSNLIDLIDDAILNHLVIAERYRTAIKMKRRPKTVPQICAPTIEEIIHNENWPYQDINVAFHEHGMMLLGIYEGNQPK